MKNSSYVWIVQVTIVKIKALSTKVSRIWTAAVKVWLKYYTSLRYIFWYLTLFFQAEL